METTETTGEPTALSPAPVFREIHKNTFLKRILSDCFPRKKELVWVVFCVHDDTEALLESYVDKQSAVTHKPDWSISLNNTLHVSPTICPTDREYEFVITLNTQVLRFAASSWQLMAQWVEVLRNKLEEMQVLSPRENFYSKPPELRNLPLLPTRDPNSPLPAPPAAPTVPVPGTEIINPFDSTSETRSSAPSSSSNSTHSESLSTRYHRSLVRGMSLPNGIDSNSVVVTLENNTLENNVTIIQVNTSHNSDVFDFNVLYEPLADNQSGDIGHPEPNQTVLEFSNNTSHNENQHYEQLFLQSSPSFSNHTPRRLQRLRSLQSDVAEQVSRAAPGFSESDVSRGRCTPRDRTITPSHRSVVNAQVETMEIMEHRLQPAPQPYRMALAAASSQGRLTLREQQVLQLQKEMFHPGGVRIQLRRKDCISSIALVDVFGAVWIAGWKQKEHPMLYNALHIGDQLISTEGVVVQNASEAHRFFKNTNSSLYVNIVVKRVPFGKVFVVKKQTEGQPLGIVREDNTAVIQDVIPNSLIAKHGLTPKTQTCDGLSITNWVLTEINGRPLNLFFKDNEVEDRLNSVGLDMSILVQPQDLVKNLKKQLKSLRNYKDYILQ